MKKRKLQVSSLVLFYFFSNSMIQDEVIRLWEVPAIPYEDVKDYDVGIILGGILAYDESLNRIQFARGSDRLWQAMELYKMGKIKKLLFTGGSGSITYANHKEGPLVKRYLNMLGIPGTDILIEGESKNTRENVLFSKNLLPGKKILLITSGMHMRRAKACFEKEGIAVDTYSVDRYSGPRKFAIDHAFIPNAETLFSWNNLFHEWIGYITYKVMGYV